MQVKPSAAIRILTKYIEAKLVPILAGSPGCGKSQIYQQIADYYNLMLIDIRLAQCDPTDLNGYPKIEGNKASYVPMSTFPIEGDPLPKNPVTGELYAGWLILFDEITSAPPAIQSAAYKIILDRMVGQHKLHRNVAMCAAGNLETDNAVVYPMSTALQSRLVHLELLVDPEEWTDWANAQGIDQRITSYIAFKPGNLYTFVPDHSDKTYACPRTWEFSDRILKVTEDNAPERLPMLAGALSEGVAREFLVFCKIYKDLPSMAQIVANPESIKVPVEPSVLFALTGAIAHNITTDNLSSMLKFVNRLPVEFKVVCLKAAYKRTPAIAKHPAFQEWLSANKEMFS